jgi:hypothetical protein
LVGDPVVSWAVVVVAEDDLSLLFSFSLIVQELFGVLLLLLLLLFRLDRCVRFKNPPRFGDGLLLLVLVLGDALLPLLLLLDGFSCFFGVVAFSVVRSSEKLTARMPFPLPLAFPNFLLLGLVLLVCRLLDLSADDRFSL